MTPTLKMPSLVSMGSACLAFALLGCPAQPVARDNTPPAPPVAGPGGSQPIQPAMGPPLAQVPGAGVIVCGAALCDAKASACVFLVGKPPQCVSRADRDSYARGGSMDESVLDCDDDADCPSGQHCCAGQYWGGTGPHIHECTKEKCMDAIACTPATGCPPKLACKAVGTSGDAHCEPAMTGTSCGAARCSVPTPVCCWDSAKSVGKCMAEPGQTEACTGEGEERIRCRGRSDCGGYDCCQYMALSTDCASSCPGVALGVVCETYADCPPEGPGPGGIRQRYDRCENHACTGKLCNPGSGWVPCDSI